MEEKLEKLDHQLATAQRLLKAVKKLVKERQNYGQMPTIVDYLKSLDCLKPDEYDAPARLYYGVLQALNAKLRGVPDKCAFVTKIFDFAVKRWLDTPPYSLEVEFDQIGQELDVPASRVRRWYRIIKKEEKRKEKNE